MKVKTIKGNDRDLYIIYFGGEIFNAYYNKEFPRLGQWSLSRRTDTNAMFDTYFPVYSKEKFKDLRHIKKFIKDRKWL